MIGMALPLTNPDTGGGGGALSICFYASIRTHQLGICEA